MSKDLEDIKVYESSILSCPVDRSPIFFVNVTADIRQGNSKKAHRYQAEKIVVKGTLEEIKKSDQTKKQFLREFFKHESGNGKKKVLGFDLEKIEIVSVEIIRGLGYGIKSS